MPQRGFCQILDDAITTANLKQQPVVSSIYNLACKDCKNHVFTQAARSIDTNHLAIDLPPCSVSEVLLDLEKIHGAESLSIKWEHHINFWVLAYFIAGAVLVCYYEDIGASSDFHMALGGAASFLVVTAFVAWWIFAQARQAANGVPLGGFIFSAAMLGFAYVGAQWQTLEETESLWALVMKVFGKLSGWYIRDDTIPIGWIIIIGSVSIFLFLIYYGADLSRRFFASNPEPEGDTPFEIGSNGQRIDRLPPTPFQQRCLSWLVLLIGCCLLLQCTYVDMVSLTLWLLVFFKGFLENTCAAICGHRNRSNYNPGEHRRLLSADAYRQQGEEHTRKALEQLRRQVGMSLARNDLVGMSEGSELKLRRFSQGGPHCTRPHDDPFGFDERRRCTLL